MDPGISLVNHPCLVCLRSTTMWCSRCQNAWYCTAEHLQSDWPRHRRECAPIVLSHSDMIATAIPVASQEDRPRLITANYEPPRMPLQGSFSIPLIQGHFPGGQTNSFILTQGLNGELLRFPLQLWYSPGALAANGPTNQAPPFEDVQITNPNHGQPQHPPYHNYDYVHYHPPAPSAYRPDPYGPGFNMDIPPRVDHVAIPYQAQQYTPLAQVLPAIPYDLGLEAHPRPVQGVQPQAQLYGPQRGDYSPYQICPDANGTDPDWSIQGGHRA